MSIFSGKLISSFLSNEVFLLLKPGVFISCWLSEDETFIVGTAAFIPPEIYDYEF